VRAVSEVRVVSLHRTQYQALVDATTRRVRGRRASQRAAPGSPGRVS
jgi:hypothetical protein